MAKQTSATEGKIIAVTELEKDKYRLNNSGIAGDRSAEYIGTFYSLKNEKVISGDNDSYIVLGRDRPGRPSSGYGGEGYTRASSIDIVVGRMSSNFSVENLETLQSGIWLNPDFENDAARIHISQKTDIDDNFLIPDTVHKKGFANSGIGLKADNVRLVSRQSIKLVSSYTRVDSSNLNIEGAGIELIAIDPEIALEDYQYDPNKTYETPPVMQPIPKGENLARALDAVMDSLDKMTGIIANYVMLQTEMNKTLAAHTHIETFFGNQGIQSIDLPAPLFSNIKEVLDNTIEDIKVFKRDYINDFKNKYTTKGLGSSTYINSKYHFLN